MVSTGPRSPFGSRWRSKNSCHVVEFWKLAVARAIKRGRSSAGDVGGTFLGKRFEGFSVFGLPGNLFEGFVIVVAEELVGKFVVFMEISFLTLSVGFEAF